MGDLTLCTRAAGNIGDPAPMGDITLCTRADLAPGKSFLGSLACVNLWPQTPLTLSEWKRQSPCFNVSSSHHDVRYERPGFCQFNNSRNNGSPTFGPTVTKGQGDFRSIQGANGATYPSAKPTTASTDDCAVCVASQWNLQLSQDQRNLTGSSCANSWLGGWLGGASAACWSRRWCSTLVLYDGG